MRVAIRLGVRVRVDVRVGLRVGLRVGVAVRVGVGGTWQFPEETLQVVCEGHSSSQRQAMAHPGQGGNRPPKHCPWPSHLSLTVTSAKSVHHVPQGENAFTQRFELSLQESVVH